jgi:hypothetical protein
MTTPSRTLLWERLDELGWETVSLTQVPTGWEIDGRYVGRHEGHAVAADYKLMLDAHWVTVRLDAAWGIGPARRAMTLDRLGTRWHVDGTPRPDLDGCIDVDIRWTPLTNSLPIRRLGLPENATRDVDIAWIAEGDLTIHRAPQRYTRTGANTWRFESLDTGFLADLQVDDDGFVIDYPGFFRRLAGCAASSGGGKPRKRRFPAIAASVEDPNRG